MSGPKTGDEQRIDQWLWYARLAKSRTLAQALVERGKVRINRLRIGKASHAVKPGDVLTLSMGPRVRVIEVRGIGARRGPATEAQLLFVEIESTVTGGEAHQEARRQAPGAALQTQGAREAGSGRPTKRDRRAIVEFKRRV